MALRWMETSKIWLGVSPRTQHHSLISSDSDIFLGELTSVSTNVTKVCKYLDLLEQQIRYLLIVNLKVATSQSYRVPCPNFNHLLICSIVSTCPNPNSWYER